jgi:O-antigen ligase
MKIIENYRTKYYKIIDVTILILPILFILGAPWTNACTILFSFLFLHFSYKEKKWEWLSNKWIILFLIFWIYNLINGFFSTNSLAAIKTSFFYLRFLFFSLLISTYGFYFIKFDKIIKFWLICLLLVTTDLFIQYIFKVNLLGYPPHGVRYSGVFGNELIIGSFLSRFLPLVIPLILFYHTCVAKKYLKYGSYLLILFFLFNILISGERTAFIVFFVYIICLLFYHLRKNFIRLLLIGILIFSTLSISILSTEVKGRYNDFTNIILNFDESSYGKLWSSGYNVWKLNYINGVGFKNFRVDCDLIIVDKSENTHQLCSSHPHNLYLELLSETGIIGLVLFILMFYYLLKQIVPTIFLLKENQQKYLYISCLIMILIYLWPVITYGSFYTSLNGLYIWLHISLLNYLRRDYIK